MKKICIILAICLLCSVPAVHAEQENLTAATPFDGILDDCIDFSKVYKYSNDGLSAIESIGEDRSVFEEDFTFFQRVTTEAKSVIYEIPEKRFLSVQTYFWQGEALKHFSFTWSADGIEWQRANPAVKTKNVGSDKWTPINYEFKKLPQTAKYLKITFPEQNSVAWSPVISSIMLHSFPAGDGGFIDTNNTPYHEAVTVLKHLGFINGITETEFDPDGSITRAEFCALIARVLNFDKQGILRGQPMFSDIEAEYWGRASIEALCRLGIINGTSVNLFSPEENVSFSQAIKIIVSALGYAPDAKLEGGYPLGYLTVAKRLHLIDRIDVSEQSISRGEAALLLYHATDIDCMERNVYGDKEKYNKNTQSLLKKYHNIEKLKSIITEAGSASITGGKVLDEKYFVAGGVQYNCGRMEMEQFLGQNTTFYIQIDSNADIHTALYAFSDTDSYTDIKYPEFVKLDRNKIYYEKDGKEKKVMVNSDTRIVYNGRYLSRIGLEKQLPFQSGTLRLIDNNNDKVAEIVSITDYQTYYLSADAKLGSVLSDLYLGAVTVGLENMQHVSLICYDEKIEYNHEQTVRAGDVVQFACSKDGVRAQVLVLNDYTAGRIEQYSEKDQICQISGISYRLSDYFIKSGQVIEPSIEEVLAYLDSNGAIVALTYPKGLEYAYLQSISLNGAFDTEGIIRLIRESGKTEHVLVTTKTKLNGKKLKESEFSEKLNNLKPQLIQIRLYSDGSAAELQTAYENKNGTPLDQKFSCDYQTEGSIYRAGNFTLFDSLYQLTNATKVFIIPKEPTKTEQYYVGGTSLLHADLKYKAELFDLNHQYEAAAAVVYQAGSTERNISAYDLVMVVEECSTYLNDENEYAIKVNGWVGGEQTELLFRADGAENQTGNWLPYSSEKTTIAGGENSFVAGDVIQFVKDYSGYCDKFRVLFDATQCTEINFYEQNAGDYGGISRINYYSELYSGYGTIERIFSNKLFYCANIAEIWSRTVMTTNAKVYFLDSKKSKIRTAELSDLEIGNQIFVRMNFTNCNEIVIVQ